MGPCNRDESINETIRLNLNVCLFDFRFDIKMITRRDEHDVYKVLPAKSRNNSNYFWLVETSSREVKGITSAYKDSNAKFFSTNLFTGQHICYKRPSHQVPLEQRRFHLKTINETVFRWRKKKVHVVRAVM